VPVCDAASQAPLIDVAVAATRAASHFVEERQRRGESMEEVLPPDRTDLARGEAADGRHRTEVLLDRRGVVVGALEEVRAAAIAGEEQRARGAAAGARSGEQVAQ